MKLWFVSIWFDHERRNTGASGSRTVAEELAETVLEEDGEVLDGDDKRGASRR